MGCGGQKEVPHAQISAFYFWGKAHHGLHLQASLTGPGAGSADVGQRLRCRWAMLPCVIRTAYPLLLLWAVPGPDEETQPGRRGVDKAFFFLPL